MASYDPCQSYFPVLYNLVWYAWLQEVQFFFEFYSPRTVYTRSPRCSDSCPNICLSSYYSSFLNPKLSVPPWGQRIPQNSPDAVTLQNVLLLLCWLKCLVHSLLKPEQTKGMSWPAQAVVTQRPSALSLLLLTLNLRTAVYWPRPTSQSGCNYATDPSPGDGCSLCTKEKCTICCHVKLKLYPIGLTETGVLNPKCVLQNSR